MAIPDVVEAVFLDAGGVLITPDPDQVRALLAASVPGLAAPSDEAVRTAHYRAMAALDLARSAPETFDAYLPTYLRSLGAPDDAATLAAAHDLWAEPHLLWTRPIPGAADAVAALVATGRTVLVVSNSNGRVADALRAVVQVGPGPGVEVAAIVDSGSVGVAKPDPGIFEIALSLSGTTADRAIHVGDAYSYDVGGARAAGVTPVFVDPLGLHPDPGCTIIESLADLPPLLDP